MHLLEHLGLARREQRAWALYDVANSAWITTVLQIFPLFFVRVAAAGMPPEAARARFALVTSLSVVLVGLAGPLLGAIADYRRRKKFFLAVFLAVGAAATAAMFFIQEGRSAFALTTFAIGNACVMSTLAFYNALLPAVASGREMDRVSAGGFALGYLGGGALLAVNAVMIASPEALGLGDASDAIRVSLLMVAVWWVLFSIPLFRRVPEPDVVYGPGESPGDPPVTVALRRLRTTFRDLRRYRDAAVLLFAFLIYNDAVNTIVRMGVVFADEIGVGTSALIGALVMAQFVGVPFAFAFGWLADRIGAQRAILVSLAGYAAITLYAYTLQTTTQFFVLAFCVATVQGGAQSLGRSLFGSMVPRHKAGELFGFFGVFDRFGGAIGAFVASVMVSLTGSIRPTVFALVLFFAIGAFLLSKVDVERGRRIAKEADSGPWALS